MDLKMTNFLIEVYKMFIVDIDLQSITRYVYTLQYVNVNI